MDKHELRRRAGITESSPNRDWMRVGSNAPKEPSPEELAHNRLQQQANAIEQELTQRLPKTNGHLSVRVPRIGDSIFAELSFEDHIRMGDMMAIIKSGVFTSNATIRASGYDGESLVISYEIPMGAQQARPATPPRLAENSIPDISAMRDALDEARMYVAHFANEGEIPARELLARIDALLS